MSKKRQTHRQAKRQTRQQPKQQAKQQPQKQAKHQPQQKVRGGWLTAAIILVILHGLLVLGVIYGNNLLTGADVPPTWLILSTIGVSIADIVAGIALWNWKGWGFYLYMVATFVIIGLGIVASGYAMLWSFSSIIPFVIVGYIMRSKWKYFD